MRGRDGDCCQGFRPGDRDSGGRVGPSRAAQSLKSVRERSGSKLASLWKASR